VIRLTLFSRENCHLCEVMLGELQAVLAGRAEVEVVDIDEDAALQRRYALRIPVLADGERELCRYRLDAAVVEAHLARHGA
jgi:hypothetical protein